MRAPWLIILFVAYKFIHGSYSINTSMLNNL